MFNSSVIDVGIGLIFVYLILGLMCTTVHEWIAQCFKMRAANLRAGIQGLVPALANSFYNHALIKSLSKPGKDPSYVPARTFAMAVMDILHKQTQPPVGVPGGSNQGAADQAGGNAANALDSIRSAIDALPESDTKQSLQILLQHANNDLALFQKNVETWFNDAMDRVSGWYKKKTQIITAVVAAGITIFANADTIQIARKLFLNPTLRDKIVQDSAAIKRQPATPVSTGSAGGAREASPTDSSELTPQQKADLGELTGWSSEFKIFHRMLAEHQKPAPGKAAAPQADDAFPGWDLSPFRSVFWCWLWSIAPSHLLGWFLTAVAVSLGAPFWFDTLNRFMNIRSAGTAPDEKGKDRSKV